MFGIFRKDFYLERVRLWPCLAIPPLYSLFSIFIIMKFYDPESPTNGLIPFPVFCNSFIFFTVFCACEGIKQILLLADQNRKSRHYFMTTPLCVKGCVAAKYYECAIVSLCGFLYLMLYELVIVALTGQVMNHSLLFMCLLFIGLFLSALGIPFYILLGRNGMHVKTALILLLLFLALLYGLFGDITPFLGKETFADRMQKALLSSDNEAFLSRILGVDYPKLLLLTLAPPLVLLLYYISYRISCIRFRKGVERDD